MRYPILALMTGLACVNAVAENLTVIAKSVRGNGVIWLAAENCKIASHSGQSALFAMKDGGHYGCWRLNGKTVELTWYSFSDPDSKGLRTILEKKSQNDQAKSFVAIEGSSWPLVTSDKAKLQTPEDRLVKGWGDDLGWQWKDLELRKYDKKWRTLNLASPVDCTAMSSDDVRLYERVFKGQVVHIRDSGLPVVLMVRDGVHITFMPVDAAYCRFKAEQIQASRFY